MDELRTTSYASLRVAMLSSWDRVGGAAVAAYRLHQGLAEVGVPSRLIAGRLGSVTSKAQPAATSRLDRFLVSKSARLQRLAQSLMGFPEHLYHPGWPLLGTNVNLRDDEIVHAHWIADGTFLVHSLERFRGRLVLTLHDMWYFTGGCHYDAGCSGFLDGCRTCPMVATSICSGIPGKVWQSRMAFIRKVRPVVISPSKWLADQARSSPILGECEIHEIPYTLNCEVYRPMDAREVRAVYGLRPEDVVVGFSAFDVREVRKGWHHLERALAILRSQGRDFVALVIGAHTPGTPSPSFQSIWTGQVRGDDQMNRLLSALDVYVAPSEQDNSPLSIMEALACGIPCVGFRTGGVQELIQDSTTGFLATPFSAEDLASCIGKAIECRERMSREARAFALERFRELGLSRHIEIYRELQDRRNHVDRRPSPMA